MNDLQTIADGLFYPADEDELDKLLENMITGFSFPEQNAEIVVTPHAAYNYCGTHMAAAYRILSFHDSGHAYSDKKTERIIVICPLHRESKEGVFLTRSSGISIPTGRVSFDTETVKILEKIPYFTNWEVPFFEEPGMEVQLPFIKKLFPDVPVLPLFARMEKKKTRKALAESLLSLSGSKIAVSSNLTGFLDPAVSRSLAEEFIAAVESGQDGSDFDPETWNRNRKGGLPRPCGIDILSAARLYLDLKYPGNRTVMKPLSWGADTHDADNSVPATENRNKATGGKSAYYGGFSFHSVAREQNIG